MQRGAAPCLADQEEYSDKQPVSHHGGREGGVDSDDVAWPASDRGVSKYYCKT
jgi:hypothetical protein